MKAATSTLTINHSTLNEASLVLRAIDHALRQKILMFIERKKVTTVTELYRALQLEQSVASQHLGILRKAGFVVTARQGKHVLYSLNYSRFDEVHQFTTGLSSE